MSEDDNHEEEPRRLHLLTPVRVGVFVPRLALRWNRWPPPRLNRPLRLRRREKSERSIDLEEVTRETGVK